MRATPIWEVRVENTPLLIRKCTHCGNDRFYCSEKFRMNAQKRNLDIWLIYSCTKCDSTYNMTLFSRIKPESIGKNLFHQFSGNNMETVWKYAFSEEIRRRNKVEMDVASVEYKMEHDPISIEDILNYDRETVLFKIKYPFDFGLKLSAIIRICLNLSANKLKQLIEAKIVSVQEKHLRKKHKVKDGAIVQIDREKLSNIWVR